MKTRKSDTKGLVRAVPRRNAAIHNPEPFWSRLLQLAYSPLFTDQAPYSRLTDIPEEVCARNSHILNAVARGLTRYRAELTDAADAVPAYLHSTKDDVRALALELARQIMPPVVKVRAGEKLLGAPIPGKIFAAQLARVYDARYWRRALRVRILRAREHFFLRLHLLGRGKETYASDATVAQRAAQLRRQTQWMEKTTLVPRMQEAVQPDDETFKPVPLAKVAAGSRERFAKLHAFVKAMDTLAQVAGLSAAMVTLTLEPAWYPNPSHGADNWNVASPRDAHQPLCKRWQAILRDLHRVGIRLSGLRVAEPHQDACPHWHIWLLYWPEFETRIFAAILRYFPRKLKIRAPSRRGEKNTANDIMFESRSGLLDGLSRP